MPFFLTRFSYTPATWAKLIQIPEDRRTAATREFWPSLHQAARLRVVLLCQARRRR
jgi:hypothetical protein